ncbi:flagellar filament capping protein FliD [Laribacter hongkongensis]|uniref:flagellar filament capping protein FliD n=1 Tax=Laribacter hongkongensis TaxID=168471 RepID=UPI001EFD1301|nr:flagellar filament capping protein FliD [Laribacter hongkongensis]MCG9042292.1 flagellar filament capping protein FliD [Laribacter hongkongensis]MCG9056929.1 flagellar filament capping protein FliD [Laribacter hongkongensis]MCG9069039.1 flagellar filament capping protein FliD [Laribacter hongkongensis]
MGISSAGVGSGLDLEGIISSLMAIEKRPLQKLEQQKKYLDTQVSDLGKIKNALSSLKEKATAFSDPDFFNSIKATGSDDTIGRVTVNGGAVPGMYNVSVTQIAQSRVDSLDVSSLSPDANGNVTLPAKITVAGAEITLGSSPVTMSVKDLVGRINAESGIKVSAALVKSSGGDKIVFTSKQSGEATGYSDADFSFGAGVSVRNNQLGKDAVVNLNGVIVKSATNKIDDVIPGVSLSISKAGSFSINVEQDNDAIAKGVEDFVNAYNEVVGLTTQMSTGSFKGDGLMRSIKGDLYSSVYQPEGATSMAPLAMMGVEVGVDGKLKFTKSKFEKAFKDDPDTIKKNLTATSEQMKKTVDSMLNDGGLVDGRQEVLDGRIKTNQKQQDSMNVRLEKTEAALRKQYTALDVALAEMQQSLSRMMSMLR